GRPRGRQEVQPLRPSGRDHDPDWLSPRLAASELCDLQWSQVELATGRLHVRRAKNGSPSVHPMQGDEIPALRRLQREQGLSSHVFMTERDSRVGGKKLVDRLIISTKAKVEGGKSLTSSAQPPPTS